MSSDKTPIVCDLNVWYCLSDGTFDPQKVESINLTGTYVNAYELGCTRHAYRNYTKLRAAVIAFGHYSKDVFKLPPPSHIERISGFRVRGVEWRICAQMLTFIQSQMISPIIEEMKQSFEQHDASVEYYLAPFNQLISDHRNDIKNPLQHKEMSNQPGEREKIKDSIKSLLTRLSGDKRLNWDNLELFLSTFSEWVRQLSIQPISKLSGNDWHDLMNLVYVQPGSLYWTCDEMKTKKFIVDAGMGHYLYNHEEPCPNQALVL